MFESGQFYVTDPVTGIQSLNQDDPTTMAFYNSVLGLGGLALFGSLFYLAIVFTAEVLGHVPDWVRKMFASKKSASRAHMHSNMNRDTFDDGTFEMANVGGMYSNPLQDLEAATKDAEAAALRAQRAEAQIAADAKQKQQMVQQMKRLKQENARHKMGGKLKKGKAAPRTKKEMKPRQMGD